jgi:DNA polymerase III epsilon subunit-like protein
LTPMPEITSDRADVIAWAQAVLDDPNAVILDLETDGLASHGPSGGEDLSICEIGVVSVTGQVLIDRLICPVNGIRQEATAVHQIAQTDVADAPDFWNTDIGGGRTPRDELMECLKGARVVSFNVAFEQGVLHSEDGWSDEPLGDWMRNVRWECAQEMYGQFLGVKFPAQPGSLHRAVPDCYATLSLLHMMAKSSPGGLPAHKPIGDLTKSQLDYLHILVKQVERTHEGAKRCIATITDREDLTRLCDLSFDEASRAIDHLKESKNSYNQLLVLCSQRLGVNATTDASALGAVVGEILGTPVSTIWELTPTELAGVVEHIKNDAEANHQTLVQEAGLTKYQQTKLRKALRESFIECLHCRYEFMGRVLGRPVLSTGQLEPEDLDKVLQAARQR